MSKMFRFVNPTGFVGALLALSVFVAMATLVFEPRATTYTVETAGQKTQAADNNCPRTVHDFFDQYVEGGTEDDWSMEPDGEFYNVPAFNYEVGYGHPDRYHTVKVKLGIHDGLVWNMFSGYREATPGNLSQDYYFHTDIGPLDTFICLKGSHDFAKSMRDRPAAPSGPVVE